MSDWQGLSESKKCRTRIDKRGPSVVKVQKPSAYGTFKESLVVRGPLLKLGWGNIAYAVSFHTG